MGAPIEGAGVATLPPPMYLIILLFPLGRALQSTS